SQVLQRSRLISPYCGMSPVVT
ncbi:hypothetical protein Pmar_PMAR000620, partial [Perkinsus marinus ATCC 50983]